MIAYRIGGEMEIKVGDILKGEHSHIEYSTKKRIYTDLGRSALYISLKTILRQDATIKDAWLPKYCCESVLLPFQQLNFNIHFYSMGQDLMTPCKLPKSLDHTIFLFIHYFGIKNNAILQWLSSVTKERCYLIEDCVQAGFSKNTGMYGDFVIRSYRKFLPQPDGALLTSKYTIDFPLAEPDETFLSQKIVGKLLREYNGNDQEFLQLLSSSEERIDKEFIPRRMSWISEYLLKRTNIEKVCQQRKENWKILSTLLRETKFISKSVNILFSTLDELEVPLGFPILLKRNQRDSLRRYLMMKNVFCPIHWPIANLASGSMWLAESQLSESLLTLPIDQRVNCEMLQFMVNKIVEFVRGVKV